MGSDHTTLPSLALREADTHRSVRAYFGVALVAVVGVASLVILGGPPALWWPLLICAIATGLYCFWLAWSRRGQGVFSDTEATSGMMLMCISAVMTMAYVGPMTAPAVMLAALMMGLAMGNPGRGRRGAVIVMVGYAVVSVLGILGHIDPVSEHLFAKGDITLVLGLVLVEAVLAIAFFVGLTARRSTSAALEHVQRAQIALAGREALLQEAFADLRRLGGGQGRLSGAQLGNYRLEGLLGRGGMGEVYRAKDLKGGVSVAVKVLHANLVPEQTLVERFFREADLSSSLASPHIVEIIGHATAPDGSPYIVMELLEGRPLNEILRDEIQLDLQTTDKLCRDVASALSTAHEANIIHRDVKLANLILTKEGDWKLLDFGICKLHGGSRGLTRGGPIGTPGYMPPEQAHGGTVDARTDIFAFGVVLYRVLTGRAPFAGHDALATVFNSINRQPLQPTAIAEVPRDVEHVLALALAKRKSDRFETADALREAFSAAVDHRLDKALRQRAAAVIDRMPWGIEVELSVQGRIEGPEGETQAEDASTLERRTS